MKVCIICILPQNLQFLEIFAYLVIVHLFITIREIWEYCGCEFTPTEGESGGSEEQGEAREMLCG